MTIKERNSNFDFLRIISMLLIVFHHSVVRGILRFSISLNSLGGNQLFINPHNVWMNSFICESFAMFGKLAVAIFVMISGYFLIDSQSTYKKIGIKIFNLVVQVYFYSISIYLIATHFNWIQINPLLKLQSYVPFVYNTYYFITDYLILYLLYPYLNILIKNLTKRQHLFLIVVLSLCFTVIPIFTNAFISGTTMEDLIVFIMYYIIGSYIRLYPLKNNNIDKYIGLIGFICTMLFILLIMFIFNGLAGITGHQRYFAHSFNIADQYSCAVTLASLFLMYFIKNLHVHHSKVINFFSLTMFGVYLIHDNPIMQNVIWHKWINTSSLIYTPTIHLIITILIICPIIFIACSLIDSLRLIIFDLIKNAIASIYS